MTRPAVLFLAHLFPWPLDGGGQIKSYHTLRLLASRYDVTLLSFVRPSDTPGDAPLADLCAGGVETVPLRRSKARAIATALRAPLTGQSFIVARDNTPAMRAAVARHLQTGKYVAVHVDHLQMAQFIPDNTCGAAVILDNHNIEHRIPQRLAQASGASPLTRWYAGGEWPRLQRFEVAACRRADRLLTVSPEDRDGLVALAPDIAAKTTVFPIGVDSEYWGGVRRDENARNLVSIGTMYWPPNVDSMVYFCAEILPLVRQAVPDAHLQIVGARPAPDVTALAQPGVVTVTGTVPDVRPYGAGCGVFVVPLRSGSGMRVKILNALAMGLPVVSTYVGAEGIDVTDGVNILLADTPEGFAHAVVSVLQDAALAHRLGEAGRCLMQEQYSWEGVGRHLLGVYDSLPGNKA